MIPFFSTLPAYERDRARIDKAMRRVLESGRLILGPEVAAFETEFADFVDLPHAIGVASGTDALILALRALEIKSGDEVITTANCGTPPVAAIRAVGAIPRFVDVDDRTLLIDPELLEVALSPRTRCILAVHLYGQPADMDPISQFATEHGLLVIEDCAQAHGAMYKGHHVGSIGQLGCFSFYPTKNLGACGDGGMVVTTDATLAGRVRQLRFYGYDADPVSSIEGLNSRLDELQAAILRIKLERLDEDLATRRELARQYLAGLDGTPYRPCGLTEGGVHAYHLFVVRCADRRLTAEHLKAGGIGFGVHYPTPVHRMPAYGFLGYGEGYLPLTEAACNSVMSLPLHPGLSTTDVEQICQTLKKA